MAFGFLGVGRIFDADCADDEGSHFLFSSVFFFHFFFFLLPPVEGLGGLRNGMRFGPRRLVGQQKKIIIIKKGKEEVEFKMAAVAAVVAAVKEAAS